MNVNAQGSARPSFFLGPILTKCRKSAVGLFVILSVTGVTVSGRWLLASSAEARRLRPAEAAPASVRVVEVRDEVVASGVRYSAVVKELNKAELSFRVGGTVEYLREFTGPSGKIRPIHEGDTLKRGEVIARLDPSDFRRDHDVDAGRLATAKAKLEQARADAELAKVEFVRAEQLISRHALSKSDEDSARAKLQTTSAAEAASQSEVITAQVELAKAEANLGYCTITIPFEEGTIAARYVERDERIAAGQRAFLIVDVSSVVIAFMVPDTLVGQLAIGQNVDVSCEALPGRQFRGVIHKVAATADTVTRSYPIEVRIDRPAGLRPGMVANVLFRRERRAHLLPLTSVAHGTAAGKPFDVYRVRSEKDKSVAERVPVTLEAVLDNRVVVRIGPNESLKPGDRVVATGIHRLYDGEAVQIVE